MTGWFCFLASFCSFLPTALQVTTCIWPKLFVWSRVTKSYTHAKIFLPTRHRCWDVTDQSWKKMPEIDHFVISPTLMHIDFVLQRLHCEIDSITWKTIFRRYKIFGHFAEKNDGYDEKKSEKKIENFQKPSFHSGIQIWHFFLQFFFRILLLRSFLKFSIFRGLKFWSFSGEKLVFNLVRKWGKNSHKSNC